MTYNQQEIQESTIVSDFLNAAGQGTAKAHYELAHAYSSWVGSYHPGIGKNDAKAFIWYRKAAAQGHALAQCNIGWMYETGRGIEQDDKQAVFWYRKAAEQGNTTAQCNLGFMYETGRGTEHNAEQAVVWNRRAAEQGDARGQCNLGWMYDTGFGIEQSPEQAVIWYRKAAEQGYARGQHNLGCMYRDGRGIEKNDEQAVIWFLKAAEQGYASAQYNLGIMCRDGRGIEKSEELAVVWYRKAAEQGNADAQHELGWMYENGRGVEQNDDLAVAWYQKAAEQGNAKAQNQLGRMCALGRGIAQSDVQALAWYRKAADQGNAIAQNNLGNMYQNSRGIEQNDEQAVAWYRKGSDQGEAIAENSLACMYRDGRGIEQNDKQAVTLYRMAADQGNAFAQNNLGWMYGEGRGIEKNDVQAVAWYRKAADQGDAIAQHNLGWMYENGLGVEQNDEQAVAWYRKAANQGHLGAIKNLDLINQRSQQEKKNITKPRLEASSPTVTVHPETLVHTTSRGERVRSKSEVIIANLLHHAGIDYQYETDLSVLGFSKRILPNFVFIKNKNIVIWEHLGMADDPDYMSRWAKKLAWYRENDFESGRTLFVTSEMPGLGLDVASLERVVSLVKQTLEIQVVKQSDSVLRKQPSVVVGNLNSTKTKSELNEGLVFVDFETSGLKPEDGSRSIEVGAVKVVNGHIAEKFTSLMNPNVWLSREIIDITKITNEMVRNAPPSSLIIGQLYKFLDGLPIVAHNANFDERFLRSEFTRVGLTVPGIVICSMKLARRVAPGLSSYSLSALSHHYNLESNKNAHRALPDAEQAAALWQALEKDILEKWGVAKTSVRLMSKLQEIPVKNVASFLRNWRED